MDRLYNSPWFIKIISFFIAVMLFTMVNYDNMNNQPGALPIVSNITHSLEQVPLTVYYNDAEYAVTEMPEHVQVNLRGPRNVLTMLQIARPNYEVFVDLRNLEPGTHYLNVQHRNFPNELAVQIVPETVRITVEAKRTISVPVEIDFINRTGVEEGYTVGTPIVSPVTVEITAAESIIQLVAFAKGFVDIQGVKASIEKSVPIKVYDQQGNELFIDVTPSVVDVKIPVTSPNKEVPLKVNRTGELPEGLSVRAITTEPKVVTVFGPRDVINEITHISLGEIDLNGITENTIFELDVPIPDGIEKVSPEVVTVIVEVDLEETIEFQDLPVEVIGLGEANDLIFATGVDERVTLTVRGSPTTIQRVRRNDIKVFIDVSELPVGEHLVTLQVNGPQNVTFNKPFEEIKVNITEVLSTEERNQDQESDETTFRIDNNLYVKI